MQIISEHAALMCAMIKADRLNDKKELMVIWVKIEDLNKEWAALVACTAELKQVTLPLVQRYSIALQSLIIDRKPPDDLDKIIELEAVFYSNLSRVTPDAEKMKKHWADYTVAVIRVFRREKITDDVVDLCIHKGRELGMWLDSYLY